MKQLRPLILVMLGVLGFFVTLAAVVYEGMLSQQLLFPGSTPEMHLRYNQLVAMAQAVRWLGEAMLVLAVFAGVIPSVVRRFRPPATHVV